jgi:hypothetical protein
MTLKFCKIKSKNWINYLTSNEKLISLYNIKKIIFTKKKYYFFYKRKIYLMDLRIIKNFYSCYSK